MHGGRAPPASSAGGAASSPSPLANPASHSAPHRAMNAPSATTPTSVASAASDAAGPSPRASLDASLASSDDLGVALASVRSELDEMRRARRSADASLEARLGEALPTLKDLVANEMRAEMDAAVAREVRAALERERRGGDPLERPLVDLGVSGEPSERTAGDEKGGGSSVATSRATLDEARVEALAEAKCMAIITAQIVPRVGESLRKLDARLTAAEAAVREGSAAVRDRQPTPSASAPPPLDAVRADLDELRVRVAALAEASTAATASADPSAASTEASATSTALEAVRRDVETLRGETNARLDEVIAAADLGPRASDDETEKKMSSLWARVAALEARATDAGARDAANVDAALAAASRAGERVETVERGLEGVSRGLEGVSRGFDALERRLESLEASSAAAKVSAAADAETDARVAALELALATSTSATEALIEEKLQSLATRDDGGATASGENDGVAANVASLSLELAALGERVSAASSEASDARARVAALATAVESEVLPEMETLDDRSSRLAAEGDRRDARVEDVEGVARGAREAALRAERHAATALARADARDFGRAEFSARLDRAESALDACVAGLERVERTSADSIAAVLNVVNSERDAARETTRELEHAIRRAFGDEKNAQGPGGRRRARRGGGGDEGRTNDAGGFGTPGGGDGTREDRVRSPTESNEGGFRFRSLFRRGNGNGGGDPGSAGASPRPSPSPSPSPSPGRKPPGRRESNERVI